ncbi:MAG: BioY family transporter [Deltaproteobacteria bacterium HGW-Deltaproteobacteria-12]|nr:MAG: BioY family transporter [Deltaproteobacteria bacterium HGW-Deltaproteobacteria-12]
MAAEKRSLRGMAYASMLGALTAIGAYIIIPLPPIPVTLQTLFVSLAGALLGGYLGALSQVVYILLGVIGLPVFAGGKAGFGVLIGPTGGYLIGFVIGAFIIGKLTAMRRAPGLLWLMGSMTAGITMVYTLGILQLMVVAKLTFVQAVWVGLLPPLPGDMIKIVVAALICRQMRGRIFNKI